MRTDGMDQHTRWKTEQLLAHLATHEPDLFEGWYSQQLDHMRTKGLLRPLEPSDCEEHLADLPRPHRERLARHYATMLSLPRAGLTPLTHLLGHDRELAEHLLDENAITTPDLLNVITGQRGTVLEQIGPLLLDRGTDPAHIAELAAIPIEMTYGSASLNHEHLLNFFQSLGKRITALHPVAEAGQAQQTALRQQADQQEHQQRVRGR